MKILPPQERVSVVQQERERIVRESATLVRNVDQLRELRSVEEKSLKDFREREFAKLKQDKAEKENEILELDKQIAARKIELSNLLAPKEQEWAEKSKRADDLLRNATHRLEEAKKSEVEWRKKVKNASETESSLLEIKQESSRLLVEATQKHSEAEKTLEEAKKEADRIRYDVFTLRNEVLASKHALDTRTEDLNAREKDLLGRENALRSRETSINGREAAFDDHLQSKMDAWEAEETARKERLQHEKDLIDAASVETTERAKKLESLENALKILLKDAQNKQKEASHALEDATSLRKEATQIHEEASKRLQKAKDEESRIASLSIALASSHGEFERQKNAFNQASASENERLAKKSNELAVFEKHLNERESTARALLKDVSEREKKVRVVEIENARQWEEVQSMKEELSTMLLNSSKESNKLLALTSKRHADATDEETEARRKLREVDLTLKSLQEKKKELDQREIEIAVGELTIQSPIKRLN